MYLLMLDFGVKSKLEWIFGVIECIYLIGMELLKLIYGIMVWKILFFGWLIRIGVGADEWFIGIGNFGCIFEVIIVLLFIILVYLVMFCDCIIIGICIECVVEVL